MSDDIESVTKAASERARNLFALVTEKPAHNEILNRVLNAVFSTWAVADTYLGIKEEIELARLRRKRDREARWVENLSLNLYQQELLGKISDPDMRAAIEQSRRDHYEALSRMESAMRSFDDFHESVADLYLSLNQVSLLRLLTTDDEYYSAEAVKKLMELLIGLTPAGPLVETLTTLLEVVRQRQIDFVNATDYLTRMDRYVEALFQWGIAAQYGCDLFVGRQTDSAELLTTATERFQARHAAQAEHFWKVYEERTKSIP